MWLRNDLVLNKKMSVIRQIYCTFVVSCLCLNIGIIFAWPSSTLNLFSSTNTTLNRPMTETEISLFGSLPSFTALISTPVSGVLLDILGRKRCCLLFGLPSVIAWTIASLVPRVDAILLSVSIGGLSGCMLMVAPNFISEFCQETIRGSLTSCGIIFYGVGLMVSYMLGGYLEYNTMNYVCLTISVISLAMVSLVKDSPVHLVRKGKKKMAAESIAFYRFTNPDSSIVRKELDAIRRTLFAQIDGATPEEENLKPESRNPKQQSQLQLFRKSKSTRRALAVILILYSLSILQGLIVVQVYSEPLFKEALPNISANLTSILFALLNTISGFVAAYLLDYFGRRPVMIYPSLGTCLFCIALGTQIQFHWGPSWMTAVFVYAFCISATCGAGTVPYVMITELFIPEVRGMMTMLAIEWGWLCSFVMLFIFNPFVAAVGLGPVFYVFAFTSLVSAIFCTFYLPETKGLTVDVIQDVLLGGNQYRNS